MKYGLSSSLLAASLFLLPASHAAAPPAGGYVMPLSVKLPPQHDLAQIPLGKDGATSSPGELWEEMGNQRILRDVTAPTITPFLPDHGKANGAAVIIAPGGGFMMLSMDNEGTLVARWLAAHGIAAFVLKYRLNPTPADPVKFRDQMAQLLATPGPQVARSLSATPAVALAQQDGLDAIRYVRTHAAQFQIDPQRIGFIGFSAGGMTAMNVATGYDAASRPDFVASIYGDMPNRPVPKDAPPLFTAVAADDPLLANAAEPMFNAWRNAGKPAELHIFEAGSHGFGLVKKGTSSDHWIDEFYWWLQARGELSPHGMK